MQPLNGTPIASDRPITAAKLPPQGPAADQALTPAQRTTLEKLIVRIMTLSPVKSAEIWAGLRHDLSLSSTGDLLARHFPLAEQLLQTRLSQAQGNHPNHQLRQQLTALLPQGNNRQLVSDFIRQQFGQPLLSQLTHTELRQVLVMLQSGTVNISQPQRATQTDRPLLPAEHQNIQSLVDKLSTATGEQPAKIWQLMFDMAGVKNSSLLPARHFQLISQFLQAKVALSQQTAPTLINLQSVLKQPADAQEQQRLTDYSQNRFQASPTTPLTQAQLNDIINVLFAARFDRANAIQPVIEEPKPLHFLFNPLITSLPETLRTLWQKPSLVFITLVIVMVLMLAVFL